MKMKEQDPRTRYSQIQSFDFVNMSSVNKPVADRANGTETAIRNLQLDQSLGKSSASELLPLATVDDFSAT
jgi:hypothetical protein